MIESLSTLIGPFHIKMLAVLLNATQWTVYLSLTAFIGGGLIGLIFTLMRITPINWIRKLAVAIYLFSSIISAKSSRSGLTGTRFITISPSAFLRWVKFTWPNSSLLFS